MKKVISTAISLIVLASATVLYAKEYYVENLYITSYYTVEVYNTKNEKIGFLYSGTRAKVLRSADQWLFVEYWDGRKTVTGWIRR